LYNVIDVPFGQNVVSLDGNQNTKIPTKIGLGRYFTDGSFLYILAISSFSKFVPHRANGNLENRTIKSGLQQNMTHLQQKNAL